ncbi:hypothetical protein I6N95_03830 [Vagococcus sp. BWB3-3]|uniref:Uncharacterized protein n=1 Tax=Vagococcus allomyrinae TaxID=2794353 RepID=A0A940P8N9_9ENTE|nr:hypothetical protein [Vagococcus allomyrinae]MBP1040135.1 hypothetical protein [Vagococcus allomyrinae]
MKKKRRSNHKKVKKKTFKKSFLILTIFYAFVVVIGSTYAWITMADERINRVKTNKVAIKVEGDQTTTLISPATEAEKNITVRNVSTSPGFVRVSLEEVLLTFQIDTRDRIGNGNVKKFNTAEAPEIKKDEIVTWLSGKTYKVSSNVFYKGDIKQTNTFLLSDLARENMLFQYIELTQPNVTTIVGGGTGYWLYEDGYFYYSDIVKPNESTSILVENIVSIPDTPNLMKNAFYGLEVKAEGYSITETSLELMGLSPADLAYHLFNDYLI